MVQLYSERGINNYMVKHSKKNRAKIFSTLGTSMLYPFQVKRLLCKIKQYTTKQARKKR
jgi:hypothetical protein